MKFIWLKDKLIYMKQRTKTDQELISQKSKDLTEKIIDLSCK